MGSNFTKDSFKQYVHQLKITKRLFSQLILSNNFFYLTSDKQLKNLYAKRLPHSYGSMATWRKQLNFILPFLRTQQQQILCLAPVWLAER